MSTARVTLALGIATALSTGLARPVAADVHDRVDPATHFQTIDNFGASDAWTMQRVGTWSDASKQKVADLLFSTDKGIGLSCWRFNVGGGIQRRSIRDPMRTVETFELSQGQYDWQRQAPEQWFLKAAKARGVDQFLAFVNSPPGRMTRNGLTNHAGDETEPANLKPGYEGQYAAYLADILAHFRDDGVLNDPAAKIDFRYLSPVNETQSSWTGGQEGSRVDNQTLRKILLALKEELASRHLHTQVLTPESSNYADMLRPARQFTEQYGVPYGDYINYFTSQPDLADLLGHTLCHHLYGSQADGPLKRATNALGARMAQYPGWKIWMSEICVMENHRDLGIAPAITLAEIVHACMARENASAWQWWLGMSNGDYKDGLVYTDWHHPGDPESVLESKMLWALGNYSRFVRPGFVRVALTGDSVDAQLARDRAAAHRPTTVESSAQLSAASTQSSADKPVPPQGLLGTAYLDPKTNRLVVVYVNDGPADRVTLDLGNGSRRVTTYTTSDTQSLAPATVSGGPIELPAKSIVTVVADPA
jgi:O-glycosyl hydrolase